ncbi:hypothetical protein Rhe02_37450 [Rhizocola hellebori]|uniref:Recombinase domain-containing protein n=1 Tax=Rhizocola hellebori TaxID=1392758 RepID=A0A8J3Q9J0_9ACTN|nr:recombinase family protein [Rhizocola hellebori]GIH05678.1 hypothetical protein Rhe02_37450 [Rhizocola hellebori]
MTTPPGPLDQGDVSSLDWLRHQAEHHVPESFPLASIPVAWLGRTSTDDAQDPTLSLPRQLDTSRKALPPGFVIVAKFYDVESGRTTMENRGKGNAHQHLDIPIARDGGIADLLAEAARSDRRFVAVVVESIERVARVTYFSTKIEFELEKAGVALLAADEGIDHRSIPNLDNGDAPYRKATSTLTRRIKQAISEWYVLNMLELTWGGLKTHTAQGYNIGKPPYGYKADRLKHPVKAKAREGKTKHRLIPDDRQGPVVTQIFLWRAIRRLGYDDIAHRLNLDPRRYPPPEPILGQGRHRVGAWTAGTVREVLTNPKHCGYMVWNRRKRGHADRSVKGRVNPPSAWVWSPRPTHEPLVTRELFDAANAVGRYRQGSHTTPGNSAEPKTKRSYRLRSYVFCQMCGRRYAGEMQKGHTYYRCSPDTKRHAHLPWFAQHPRAAYIREDLLIDPARRFFRDRIFGAGRQAMLTAAAKASDLTAQNEAASHERTLEAHLADLQHRQANLIGELEKFEPTGDDDVDAALRGAIKNRFAEIVAKQKSIKETLAANKDQTRAAALMDLTTLDQLPVTSIDISRLPEDEMRLLFDAFQLEIRVHPTEQELVIHVTVTSETAPILA